ncbi:xanthine dehydrogenase family protein molybdopterin-binding subunit [Ramlibacter sp.]|uniref:xanthine dehydrogenase family protein molybdopterin-binding subunit n=1 Tax=Ramlibacter sp. TaxID=1917967 RepID=UPI00262D2F29|nr:xanthine dehydrogenase family protein molybdopterin-binding subunit [Ramlibacter sp.]
MSHIGKEQPRVEGPLKVSGQARYTSDHRFPGMLYAVPVCSTIANGEIREIDTSSAAKMPGVQAILERANIGPLFRATANREFGADMVRLDEIRAPLEDDVIRYYGQYVALAVADTYEQAVAAAEAVRVAYRERAPNVAPQLAPETKHRVESERGDAASAFDAAQVQVDQTYGLPPETHNPIELHASVALWDGTNYTLYETSQGVVNHRNVLAQMLGVPRENVRVITKFLGSGFGGKLWPWTQSALAAAAARQLGRPVKLVVSRRMMFQTVGHRPRIEQRIRLGATREGKLTSLRQDWVNHASMLDDYRENCGEATPQMYSVPNLRITSALARRNVGSATSMRGPGAVPGLWATESALDELAWKLGIDPVQLRLSNEPQIDEGLQLPFSSRHLKECLATGAEKFGWSQRDPRVGAMQRDGLTLGWGMAGCSWQAARFPCAATVELRMDGTARVFCATQDIGTGSYTILAQLTAESLGLPLASVEVVLGDTRLPPGPLSGGSGATAAVIPAVLAAAAKAIDALLELGSRAPGLKLAGRRGSPLAYTEGRVHPSGEPPASGMAFAELLRRAGVDTVSGSGSSEGRGAFGTGKPEFSSHSFGAHFVEVTWQPEIARLRVSRVLSVIDAGRIVNPLTGRNQIEGAVVMGIGMALFEETSYEPRSGGPINANLADYIVAANADVPALEVHFLEYPDTRLNELGARGIGEIGLAGTAAAIANAVYHATGVRVRELPIRIEDLLT